MTIQFRKLALVVGVSLAATPLWVGASESSSITTKQAGSTQVARYEPLMQLIHAAIEQDAARKQFYTQSLAMREMGVASATLMDPKVKVGFGGLPIDSFQFDQDPMTNLSVGVMQQFERGSTLELNQKKANQQAQGVNLKVEARELDIANSMTTLWLELGYQQVTEQILREKKRLMTELESFVKTNYSNGKSEAQDLLDAQLQVAKLDEKLEANRQMQRRLMAQMSEWLGAGWLDSFASSQRKLEASNQRNWLKLEQVLDSTPDASRHYTALRLHPMVKMADSQIQVSKTQVDIAEQAYTPQFGIEVMYAHRQANNMRGEPASDLVSAYLTLDIPLFTENRQDKNKSAAQYQVGAAQLQRDTLLQQMNAKVNTLLSDRINLQQRLARYQSSLMPQINARIRAVERGYQNNTAQFSDVIAASNDELALQLEQQRLLADLNVVNSNLAALLSAFEFQVKSPELTHTYRSSQ
ncbi:heavy metal RND efflux CzcC family protein [Vibrio nigripulchritudo ATCC 27043]|uniref:TolC family protein n=1 Tax=Vibrio nigripulchritudo TaxID=28173 RepID=UPI00021C0DED|nr:TolC family protein [Vibrio nigripulchritudo]EGU57749.1 heavy metal RND efflux CzcC family protein [Vibrio nigripulchritudo ATCC 27043]